MKNWKDHIESDAKVLFGKPVIKNTRVPVDLVLEKLSEGDSFDDILAAYPRLTKEDIFAVLAFSAEVVRNEIVHQF